MPGARGVRRHALQRIGLDHRHMFQSRRVEHQLGPMFFEYRADSRLVTDVRDQRAAVHLGVGFGEFEVDLPQGIFAIVQQDQRAGTERRDLTGKLAADRAAGAGHDDAAALDQASHAVPIERYLRPVEQVLDRDGAKFDGARLVGIGKRGGTRRLANLEAKAVGLGDNLGQAGAG